MKTISHPTESLILWDSNRNKSNIHNDGKTEMKLFLKESYLRVFSTMSNELADKTKQLVSLCKLWHKVVEDECKAVRKSCHTLILHDYEEAEDDIQRVEDDIQRAVDKFRGNLGEIFAEALFTSGYGVDICDPSSYTPVDPKHERFSDADALAPDGLPIGVQIKNYNVSSVPHEVFVKAAAEDRLRIAEGRIPQNQVLEYLSQPRQVILSFTDTIDIFKKDDTLKKVVVFLGPKYIESKHLHGDPELGTPANWRFFKKIADEISSLV